jgi:hypothetical protein
VPRRVSEKFYLRCIACKLGKHVKRVVSVSLLTEGRDGNSAPHILGVRAFGTRYFDQPLYWFTLSLVINSTGIKVSACSGFFPFKRL